MLPDESILTALALLEQFPRSYYAAIARPAVLETLEGRVATGAATGFERGALARLKELEAREEWSPEPAARP
jgi:hypothetical protein